MPELNHLLLLCRAGFERECAVEIQERAAAVGIYGYPKFKGETGFVTFICHVPGDALALTERVAWDELVFVRQWAACLPVLTDIPKQDRVGFIAEQLEGFPLCGEVWVEAADSEQGSALQGLCRKIVPPLSSALRKQGVLSNKRNQRLPRLYIGWMDERQLYIGYVLPRHASPWPQGILRLKFPPAAPSRSTLKLEEAWRFFIPEEAWPKVLEPGMKAVDLGACPGGWTWQLVNRYMKVVSVDNGPMDDALMKSGQVTHAVTDGFTYTPQSPVDWMVCDIADKPGRVIDLMIKWIVRGWCRFTVFNLKLPMHKRYESYIQCITKLDEACKEAGIPLHRQVRHLYHDREEITVFACQEQDWQLMLDQLGR
ncbi:23S rRNA (cytidine(2498)-2'-O)-methyltransferase RlmM [Pokkaliibacter sp. CJK22405]|uniref:23S rRNA (cytidine(2498)-2'-O)-methyltransferase RlmM n=1 Tax=Pokkaliibacter sp. CJK22405 TaxID=3384615 RepID=UPI0039852124